MDIDFYNDYMYFRKTFVKIFVVCQGLHTEKASCYDDKHYASDTIIRVKLSVGRC